MESALGNLDQVVRRQFSETQEVGERCEVKPLRLLAPGSLRAYRVEPAPHALELPQPIGFCSLSDLAP